MTDGDFENGLKVAEAESQADLKKLKESGERIGAPITPREAETFHRGFHCGWHASSLYLSNLPAKQSTLERKLEFVKAMETYVTAKKKAEITQVMIERYTGEKPEKERAVVEQIFNYAYAMCLLHSVEFLRDNAQIVMKPAAQPPKPVN